MNELGKNAESFVDHISVGILSIGMELEDFVFQVTKNNEDQRVGILMSQLPFHKMDEDNMLESSHAIICQCFQHKLREGLVSCLIHYL